MNRRLFSHPRQNPRWLVKLARAARAVLRFAANFSWYMTRMNHTPADAWKKARETHV